MDSKSVPETNEVVSVEELKYLMSAVLEENAGIRFRLLIEGKWSQTFCGYC